MASDEGIEDQRDETVPEAIPVEDRERWNALTANQRARAARRLGAILAWEAGELALDDAVKQSGLSRSRFYGVAADWRSSRSLDALGAQVGSGGAARVQIDGEAVNALQAVVAKVVSMNGDASVSQLVRMMVAASGLPEKRLPGVIRMRTIVETELRRREARKAAGTHVRIDVTAVNLPREDGEAHVVFVLLDVGTGAILGAVLGKVARAVDAYRRLGANALERMSKQLAALPWGDSFGQMEMVAGVPKSETDELWLRMVDAGIGSNVQLATKFGKYFKASVGTELGKLEITPGRTTGGGALTANNDMRPWSDHEAEALLSDSVDAHNGRILEVRGEGRDGVPPEGLLAVLNFLVSA